MKRQGGEAHEKTATALDNSEADRARANCVDSYLPSRGRRVVIATHRHNTRSEPTDMTEVRELKMKGKGG